MINKFLFFIILIFPLALNAAPIDIYALHITEDKAGTHIIFDSAKPLKWRTFSLGNPKRTIIDFENAHLAFTLNKIAFSKNHIVAIRKGFPKPGVVRMVFDMREDVNYAITVKQSATKIKMDFIAETKPVVKKVVMTPSKNVMAMPDRILKPMVIVIDAGHGGKDPGAIGQYGTREKDVVLSIARMLANLVNEQPKMRAVLTRDGDYFVSLGKRLQIARRSKADLFIAIHADSYFNNGAAGASVYSLSEHGATSLAARWLAQRENHSELGGVDLASLEDQSVILRSVLLDLAQTATTQASLRFGHSLLYSLRDVTRLHYARVEQAPFMVLKSPDIPSILVETGFISNTREEYRLRDKKHQYKMALALFEGIQDFHKKYLIKEV